ncbi:glycine zipper 2TM domain-containing protein [Janthinobacterium sp.]|uniref:glycine zipper 2TM domain-containing protein n=1 Tax=Janthinobacterium sp. TaxID=1871054 RepID=UPI00293D20F9|nr:glycine zipper 2TM domain-containing protein [Janthinobacterium sp.]
MNTPLQNAPKTRMHPLMMAAAVAVVLFCAVGTAAVMGWLPSSLGRDGAAPAPEVQAAAVQPQSPPQAQHKPVHKPAPPAQNTVCGNCGVVESVREINTRADGSGVGAAGGTVVGGLLGNQVGGGHGRELATIAGAIGGAVAGNQIEGNVKAQRSYDVTVRLDNGNTRTIHQTAQPAWRAGDQVRIVDGTIRSNS